MTEFCALIAVHPAPGGDLLILESNEEKNRERERDAHTYIIHIYTKQGRLLSVDSLWGSSVKLGTMQRRLAWPLRKDDTHTHTNRAL